MARCCTECSCKKYFLLSYDDFANISPRIFLLELSTYTFEVYAYTDVDVEHLTRVLGRQPRAFNMCRKMGGYDPFLRKLLHSSIHLTNSE